MRSGWNASSYGFVLLLIAVALALVVVWLTWYQNRREQRQRAIDQAERIAALRDVLHAVRELRDAHDALGRRMGEAPVVRAEKYLGVPPEVS